MSPDAISRIEAQKLIDQLRMGLPPLGRVRCFTVGRESEIKRLEQHLSVANSHGMLIKANYGAGKSHLLYYLTEGALQSGFVVSLVTCDASSGTRFNRMDQILGAIMRNLVFEKGGRSVQLPGLLDHFALHAKRPRKGSDSDAFWHELTNLGSWDYSERLWSQPLYIALRAWAVTDRQEVRDLVIDWLSFPWNYRSRREELLTRLVEDLHPHFRDRRPRFRFFAEDSLVFHTGDYVNSWHALRDLNELCLASGLAGLVVLFDEFEDVLTNLRNIAYQESALRNLFRFLSGDRLRAKSYYAVTPDFANKCKERLAEKGRFGFDHQQFDDLPMFEFSPLDEVHLLELSKKIAIVHSIAYGYGSPSNATIARMCADVKRAAVAAPQNRARQAIKLAVEALDAGMTGSL